MSKKQRQDSIQHLNNRLSSPQVTVCALGGLLGQSAPPEIRQRALSDTLAFTEAGLQERSGPDSDAAEARTRTTSSHEPQRGHSCPSQTHPSCVMLHTCAGER